MYISHIFACCKHNMLLIMPHCFFFLAFFILSNFCNSMNFENNLKWLIFSSPNKKPKSRGPSVFWRRIGHGHGHGHGWFIKYQSGGRKVLFGVMDSVYTHAVYMHTHTHTHTYTNTHIHTLTYSYVHTLPRTLPVLYVCIYVCMYSRFSPCMLSAHIC